MPREADHTAFIAIGSNMDSPADNCNEAGRSVKQSSLPFLFPPGPPSMKRNPTEKTIRTGSSISVIEVTTHLSPELLFKACMAIETKMGRAREEKWGPRIIDLDILFYDDYVFKERNLEIPHPGITDRSFVLTPLNEIAPDFVHPKLKKTIETLLAEIPNPQQVIRLSDS